MALRAYARMVARCGFACVVFATSGWGLVTFAQNAPAAAAPEQTSSERGSGSVSGIVVDQTGTAVAGAEVRLQGSDQSVNEKVICGDDGQFLFANVAPGSFELTIEAPGFTTHTFLGEVHAGENLSIPRISLVIAPEKTELTVRPPEIVAEREIKEQEKQRVLGFVPNFYVSYVPNAVPLDRKQKFELAWKTTIDPVSFGITGVVAGIGQATDAYSGYGQGAAGFAKRYGASYADFAVGTFIGGAVFPSLLKQDPRYFYKGTGSKRARVLYALANAVICKGDNGEWQPNYSALLGSLAAGGISNLYYPASDRGARLMFQNAAIGIAASAGVNLFQEFVVKKLTPSVGRPNRNLSQP